MRRTLRLLLALSSMLMLLGVMAPDAGASHGSGVPVEHQPGPPTYDVTPFMPIEGICTMESEVSFHGIPTSLSREHPNHGHYTFTGLTMTCRDVTGGTLSGTYHLSGGGDSDGPGLDGAPLHGQSAEGEAWSHNGHYEGGNPACDLTGEGCGTITATHTTAGTSKGPHNYLKFWRFRSLTTAWGHLTSTSHPNMCFHTLHWTIPTNTTTTPTGGTQITHAQTHGTATLLTTSNHHCG